MRRPFPPRRFLRRVAAPVIVVSVCLGAGSCTAVGSGTTSTTTRPGTQVAGSTPTSADVDAAAWASAREAAATSLVQRRVAAVASGDRAAWVGPLGSAPDADLVAAQSRVLDRMRAARVVDLRVTALRETTPPVPAAAGTQVEWDVDVSLTYRFDGFDTAARTFDLDVTLKADPARADRAVVTGWSPSERPQPWDLDGLVVRRTSGALVLAVGSARADEVLRRARTAARRVAGVWGRAEPSVWVAPASDADAGRLLGRQDEQLKGVAAATDGPLNPGRPAGADRIVVVPGAWATLRPEGRDVVLAHELTHATVRVDTTQVVPMWLSEGFADAVAFRGVDVPEATAVRPALDATRAAGLPRALPDDGDFDPTAGRLQAAYGLALLAVRTLVDEHGTAAVVRLYRAAGGGVALPPEQVGDRDAALDLALRRELGTDRADLVSAWRERIRRLLER